MLDESMRVLAKRMQDLEQDLLFSKDAFRKSEQQRSELVEKLKQAERERDEATDGVEREIRDRVGEKEREVRKVREQMEQLENNYSNEIE